MKRLAVAGVLTTGLALFLAAAGAPRGMKDGGTFKVAVAAGFFQAIDPALCCPSGAGVEFMRGTCGALMSYPDLPPPAGLRLAPDLAEAEPVVSGDGKTYTFTVSKDARFSDGTPVTARAFSRAVERILDPAMQAGASGLAAAIVGGNAVLAGKATSPAGVIVKGRTIRFRLTKQRGDFPDLISSVCAVPVNLPADPEGAKAPLASPAPYFVAEYVPNERLVLERNRFYNGRRPHHLNRIVATLGADEGSIVDDIASGKLDWGWATNTTWATRTAELSRRYGVNKSQLFISPSGFIRMFVLNTSRPLFRNNVRLRRAINFAVDRGALSRAMGAHVGTPTDHFLLGNASERIYPLHGPDLATARKLARGRTRSATAVLYTRDSEIDLEQAEILRRNLRAIGLKLEIVTFPSGQAIFAALSSGQKAFDIGRVGFGGGPAVLGIFDGRTLGRDDNPNWSYFNSPKVNRLLDRASRLRGAERDRAYDELDVQISRDAAPAIPYAFQNAVVFVSERTAPRCVVLNPLFDLTAACLK